MNEESGESIQGNENWMVTALFVRGTDTRDPRLATS